MIIKFIQYGLGYISSYKKLIIINNNIVNKNNNMISNKKSTIILTDRFKKEYFRQ